MLGFLCFGKSHSPLGYDRSSIRRLPFFHSRFPQPASALLPQPASALLPKPASPLLPHPASLLPRRRCPFVCRSSLPAPPLLPKPASPFILSRRCPFGCRFSGAAFSKADSVLTMKKNKNKSEKDKEKSYVHWTAEMDYALSAALLEQQNLGHKGANGWKGVAFTAAITAMWDECQVHISKEKISARLRTWSKHYQDISAMLDTSVFGWDWDRNVVKVDSEQVWADYIKAHPSLKHYKDKVIVNWGDLATLCGTDRATGANATTGIEACNEIDIDIEEIPNDDDEVVAVGPSRPKKKKNPSAVDMIAKAVTYIANNMDGPTSREKSIVEKMYLALAAVPDLSEADLIKAIDLLSASELKCEVFLVLPELLRKSWLRAQLDKLV